MEDKKDVVIEFFKKLDKEITKINKEDDFKIKFLLALANGEVKLSHQNKKTTRLYKDDWISQIEYAMPFLDNIVFNPKKFIKQEEHIVPVELAKKTGKESVQHLLQNTQYIDEIDESSGYVRPSKIQTINKEEDYAIYENRFVKMLILSMGRFIDYRYRFLNNDIVGKNENFIKASFDTKIGEAKVKGKFEFEVSHKKESEDAYKKYRDLVGRVDNLRMSMSRIMNSDFMKQLKHARSIVGPIQKTNILGKEINYSTCLDLWYYLQRYDETGFDVQIEQEIIPFDDGYKDEIYNLLMHSYSLAKFNIEKSYDDKLGENIKKVKSLKPTIDKYFKEVDSEYIYEEELKIPTKMELLENIKEEQERLEEELEKQKDLEQRATEKLEEIKKLATKKRKKEVEKRKTAEKEKQSELYKEKKKEQEDKILLLVRAKEIKSKEVKEQLDYINKNVKDLKSQRDVFKKEEVKIKVEETNTNIKIKKEEVILKELKTKIKNQKGEEREKTKQKIYDAMFKLNKLKSSKRDLNYNKRKFLDKMGDLDEKIKYENKNKQKLEEKLEDI